jgi:hypothetical protein
LLFHLVKHAFTEAVSPTELSDAQSQAERRRRFVGAWFSAGDFPAGHFASHFSQLGFMWVDAKTPKVKIDLAHW